eukprot:SAG25_NODE_58_length_18473_cov_99.552846_14_plen_44_part_00
MRCDAAAGMRVLRSAAASSSATALSGPYLEIRAPYDLVRVLQP